MKHTIKSNQRIDIHNSIVTVELLPENDTEKNAIKNMATFTSTDAEKELVENYLHFNLWLGDYSVLDGQKTGNIFSLKVFK